MTNNNSNEELHNMQIVSREKKSVYSWEFPSSVEISLSFR